MLPLDVVERDQLCEKATFRALKRTACCSRRRLRAVLGVLASMVICGAQADQAVDLPRAVPSLNPDIAHGRILYLQHCAKCHRRDGGGDGPREIPALAGQRQSYLIEQLGDFISGRRQGSAMHGPAMFDSLQPADVNRAQAIKDLAAYLEQTIDSRKPETGEGTSLAGGKSTYQQRCSMCHGADGGGSETPVIPRIAGQQFPYLQSRLRDILQIHREHVEAGAVPGLTMDERDPVADYLSRLPAATIADR
jgi:cytochrome c553